MGDQSDKVRKLCKYTSEVVLKFQSETGYTFYYQLQHRKNKADQVEVITMLAVAT